jgi:hypothetical protein
MIALHVLQLLQDNGFGTIDSTLWYNELPLGEQYDASNNDIAIIETGGQESRKGLSRMDVELWGRGVNGQWPVMSKKLADIIKFFKCNCNCKLPTTVVSCCEDEHDYGLVRINPVSNVESLGVDSERNAIYRIRLQLIYKDC